MAQLMRPPALQARVYGPRIEASVPLECQIREPLQVPLVLLCGTDHLHARRIERAIESPGANPQKPLVEPPVLFAASVCARAHVDPESQTPSDLNTSAPVRGSPLLLGFACAVE